MKNNVKIEKTEVIRSFYMTILYKAVERNKLFVKKMSCIVRFGTICTM